MTLPAGLQDLPDYYSVRYGCREWQASDDVLTRTQAWMLFYRYTKTPPALAEHTADFVRIEDGSGRTITSWSR